MAVDTPAKIAILGAGPIGLEAALYARFLGYEVEVLQGPVETSRVQKKVAEGHLQMLTPFGMNSSPLGLNALAAQDNGYRAPDPDEFLTIREWYERYLTPIARSDLLVDHIRPGNWPYAIGKVEIVRTDCGDTEHNRGAWDFRIYVYGHKKEERITVADIIFDCTGTVPLPIGHGGVFALGESVHRPAVWGFGNKRNIWTRPPDVLNAEKPTFAGITTLVVGDDLSAALSVTALSQLAQDAPGTEIIWVTRHGIGSRSNGPLECSTSDVLIAREELVCKANELALSGRVRWMPGTWVEEMKQQSNGRVVVNLTGDQDSEIMTDMIIAATGFRPKWNAANELQLDICPITDAPRPFSEYLLKRSSPYSVEYPAPDASALITSEPNYYVLGSKSFGRMPGFLFQHGLRQIRDVFTIIGDRADLDLYAQMK